MKKLFILLFIVKAAFSQTTVTIETDQTIAPLKDLIGVNKGPSNRQAGYRDAAITAVRTHDYHISCDYEIYSTFWNYDAASESYSLNANFDPANPQHYAWTSTDAQLEEILNNGQSVYFRLGISWPQNINYNIPPLEPPLDKNGTTFTRFAELCKYTVLHCNSDWANGLNRNINYWEVWNEPDGIFWNGTPLQFFQLYKTVADTLKALDSELMVGGPGVAPKTTLGINTTYSDEFLKYLLDHEGKLDFYSWHSYGIQNPYSLKEMADNIRQKLDDYGFIETQSHVTEINNNLDASLAQFSSSPRGAAYYVSNIITAQKSSIDKLFWYQGMGFFNPDDGGKASYNCSGYALKAYSMMLNQAPIQVQSKGDRVIYGHRQADTTNFMVLASRNQDLTRLYILVSNYNSTVESCQLLLKNLPWRQNQSIRITEHRIQDPDYRFNEKKHILNGAGELLIPLQNIDSPSLVLLALNVEDKTQVGQQQTSQSGYSFQLHPNPCADGRIRLTNQSGIKLVTITVYNILGQSVAHFNRPPDIRTHVDLDLSFLKKGLYFIEVKTRKSRSWQKITILR